MNRKAQDALVVDLLRGVGLEVSSVFDLVNSDQPYARAIPILVSALRKVDDPWIKQGIVRALTVSEAKGLAAPTLIREFQELPATRGGPDPVQSLKWAIANAIATTADDSNFGAIVELLRDRKHGRARQMLLLALVPMRQSNVDRVLVEALGDEDLTAHALMALGQRKRPEHRAVIERFIQHDDPRIRKEAARALSRLA